TKGRVFAAIAPMAVDRLNDRGEIGAGVRKHIINTALAEPRQVSFGGHFLGWFLGGFVTHGLVSLLHRSATLPRVRPLSNKPRFRPESPALSGKFDRKISRGVYQCPITTDRVQVHIHECR